ncbi:MAG: pyrimidine/purine nucleoside phosphorylase [Candidatus Cloacimonetes bacterium]|nr:pyrimidine/purine nucleoside phosphorylase [Candidatus Cloacimonadota bacterium]
MLKVNEYFEGRVKSIALENNEGNSTLGVMDCGEYEFGTSTVEHMTVISGLLRVLLPGAAEWKDYGAGETFVVPANQKFQLKVDRQTAYHCRYE